MPTLGTVRGVAAAERPTAYHADKSASLGHSNAVNELASFEQIRSKNIPRLHVFREITKFTNSPHGGTRVLLNVPKHRLGKALLFLVVET
jgi:hypothetical protein